jgi:DNA-binding CsgD family transcriptional regulator
LRLALSSYEAVSQPEMWNGFLKEYTEIVSADASLLQIHDFATHDSLMLQSFGISSALKQSYNEYYAKRNIWRERGRHLYLPGRVNLDQEMCPRPVLERSEFFNDCLKRVGISYSMGAVIARERNEVPTLTALRSLRQPAFTEPEREAARFILPHLSRAWTLHQNLGILAASQEVLDELPQGIVFLAAGRAAIWCNLAAEKMFRSNDGLTLRKGLLSASDRSADILLQSMIRSALSPGNLQGPACVSVPRPSLRSNYQVAAAPLRTGLPAFSGMPRPAALVAVTDPEQQHPPRMDVLRHVYKLTRKEAEIAGALFAGRTIEQAAGELSITYETARTHLRRIFSKTGTSRQAELLLKVAQLPFLSRPV